MPQNLLKQYHIALLFNTNKIYGRQIIKGIGEYLQSTLCSWDVFLEDEFLTKMENISHWVGDGIIADMDNPEIEKFLSHLSIPVIGVGSSYQNEKDYPNCPYVATNNYSLVKEAFEHLKNKGIENFAFYGHPLSKTKRWAKERKDAFAQIVSKAGYTAFVYLGHDNCAASWQANMTNLANWLKSLPPATGVIAVTDTRARHILQFCEQSMLAVPDAISVIGIDNEELPQYFSRISLSSVEQGCKKMGFEAAKLLHAKLEGKTLTKQRLLIEPSKLIERQSTDFRALNDPYVIQAMHYIRQNAHRGIKVEHVLRSVNISRSNLEIRFKN